MPPPLSAPAAECELLRAWSSPKGGGAWRRAPCGMVASAPVGLPSVLLLPPLPPFPVPVPHHAQNAQSNGQEGDRLAPCPHVPVPFLPPASDAAVQPQGTPLFAPCSEALRPVLNDSHPHTQRLETSAQQRQDGCLESTQCTSRRAATSPATTTQRPTAEWSKPSQTMQIYGPTPSGLTPAHTGTLAMAHRSGDHPPNVRECGRLDEPERQRHAPHVSSACPGHVSNSVHPLTLCEFVGPRWGDAAARLE